MHRHIAPATTLIDLEYLGEPEAIAACVLDTEAGLVVVDPGPSSSLDGLRAAIEAMGASPGDVRHLLLTHIHLDHAGAAGVLARENAEILVHVHERGAPHLADPARLLDSATRIYGEAMDSLWGEVAPVPERQIRSLGGGETLRFGGRQIDVACTPGHAVHQVAFLDRDTGIAFVGDTAGERYPGHDYVIPVTPPPDIDLERWRESFETLRGWAPERLFLTHFGDFGGPEAHLEQLELRQDDWAGRVRISLEAEGTDEEKARRFADEVAADLRRDLDPETAALYARSASPYDSWFGLARYWRKRQGG